MNHPLILIIYFVRGESQNDQTPFREWFGKIGEIRALLPTVPLLAVTATASKKSRNKIKQKLGILGCQEIVSNPDRGNIKLFCRKHTASKPTGEIFEWLITEMTELKEAFPSTLIFCKSIKDCAAIYSQMKLTIPGMISKIDMFHSCTTEIKKDKIRTDMNCDNGNIVVLVATNAAGMGVNYVGVKQVINFGPPQEMDTLLQHIGRAGRDGSQATHIIIYTARQLRNCDPEVIAYIKSTTCLRRQLLLPYSSSPTIEPTHECCQVKYDNSGLYLYRHSDIKQIYIFRS